jgi:hypothetical protein
MVRASGSEVVGEWEWSGTLGLAPSLENAPTMKGDAH